MSRTQQQTPQQQTTDVTDNICGRIDPASLLEQVLANTSAARATELLSGALTSRIDKLREVLPSNLKGEAERFIRRAALYFSHPDREKLRKCSMASVFQCVVNAAELGLALDGRLAHAVPYGPVAQLQLDYKGILAVARRSGTIADCYARIVGPTDEFIKSHEDGADHLIHAEDLDNPPDNQTPIRGAYACVILPSGAYRYEWMPYKQLVAIRARSKASNNGPWVTDTLEMFKKTVIKRALKTYTEDPSVGAALALDEEEYTVPVPEAPTSARRIANKINGVPDQVPQPLADEAEVHDEAEVPNEPQDAPAGPPATVEQEALCADLIEEAKQAETLKQLQKVGSKAQGMFERLGGMWALWSERYEALLGEMQKS